MRVRVIRGMHSVLSTAGHEHTIRCLWGTLGLTSGVGKPSKNLAYTWVPEKY